MIDLNTIKFDVNGLVPAIVQDINTRQVLTLAYMNRESLEISLKEGYTCFYSRSRRQLWRKGESSGNTQKIISITADCDTDALLVEVHPNGPACHTGKVTCFHSPLLEPDSFPFSIDSLYELLVSRKAEKKEGSYTSYLFEKGEDKILKKIGEECTEVIIAAKNHDKAEIVYEISDLIYHTMVLMVNNGISPQDVKGELASRHVIDKKVKQERMQ